MKNIESNYLGDIFLLKVILFTILLSSLCLFLVNSAQASINVIDTWTLNNTASSSNDLLATKDNNATFYTSGTFNPFATSSYYVLKANDNSDIAIKYSGAIVDDDSFSVSFWVKERDDAVDTLSVCDGLRFYLKNGGSGGTNVLQHILCADDVRKPDITGATFTNESPTWNSTTYGNKVNNWNLFTYVLTEDHLDFYINDTLFYATDYTSTVNYSAVDYWELYQCSWYSTTWYTSDITFYSSPLTATDVETIYDLGYSTADYNPEYCGDTTCNNGETYLTCPGDCPAANYNQQLIFPDFVYHGFLIPDTYTNFWYHYPTDPIIAVANPDFIKGYLCDNSTCANPVQIAFDNGVATSSTSSIVMTGQATGTSFFALKSPTDTLGTTTSQTKFYKIVPYHYNTTLTEWFQAPTSTFVVVWQSQDVSAQEIYDYYGTSTESILGNAHTLACSEENWASTSTLQLAACAAGETVLSVVFAIVDATKLILQLFINALTSIFPFNIPKGIYDSWIESETTSLPAEIEFLDIGDENGNVAIIIPAIVGSATTSWDIWGPTIFAPTGTDDGPGLWFARFRLLSKYFMWALFIFGIWKLGKKLYSEIKK